MRVGNNNALYKKIIFGKSIIKLQRCSEELSLEEIDNISQKYNAGLLVVEMNIMSDNPKYKEIENAFLTSGYKDLKYFLSPTKTSYIDLSAPNNSLFHSFDRDIQRNIKRNLHKPIKYLETRNFDYFYTILNEFSKNNHIFVQSKKFWMNKWKPFDKKIHLLLSYMGDTLLGGNMFIITPPLAYGIFIPSTEKGKANDITASLIWEGIINAKNAGCTQFDLNGMYDDRYNEPLLWKGLSVYKKKFKGHEVKFMKAKVKTYSLFFNILDKLGILWLYLYDCN